MRNIRNKKVRMIKQNCIRKKTYENINNDILRNKIY